MKWINEEYLVPDHGNDVLVTDGESYAVAWYKKKGCSTISYQYDGWQAAPQLLYAGNYDGNCHIEIDGKITHWMELPELPEGEEE